MLRPSSSITRQWAGPAPGSGDPAPLHAETRPLSPRITGIRPRPSRAGGAGQGCQPHNTWTHDHINIKGKMERDNSFHGQVREEGLEEPELPESGQQQS